MSTIFLLLFSMISGADASLMDTFKKQESRSDVATEDDIDVRAIRAATRLTEPITEAECLLPLVANWEFCGLAELPKRVSVQKVDGVDHCCYITTMGRCNSVKDVGDFRGYDKNTGIYDTKITPGVRRRGNGFIYTRQAGSNKTDGTSSSRGTCCLNYGVAVAADSCSCFTKRCQDVGSVISDTTQNVSCGETSPGNWTWPSDCGTRLGQYSKITDKDGCASVCTAQTGGAQCKGTGRCLPTWKTWRQPR